jgi:hypothetical protein
VSAAQAPTCTRPSNARRPRGLSHLILDGTTIGSDRVRETKTSRKGKEIDAWYSGKTHDFGGLLQALMDRTETEAGACGLGIRNLPADSSL